MKIRLYGGPGDGRMVYIPASVNVAPPLIAVPAMSLADYHALLPLDPDLERLAVGIRYRHTGLTDPDGYARYTYAD